MKITSSGAPAPKSLTLDGSQSKNKVLQDALRSLQEIWDRHYSDSHTPWLEQMQTPPLTPHTEQWRLPDGEYLKTPSIQQLTNHKAERRSTLYEVWVAFISRALQKNNDTP